MKILFPIGAFYPSQIGGPCNTLHWHCMALKANGIAVTVITTTVGIKNDMIVVDEFIALESGRTYYGKGNSLRFKTIKKALQEIKNTDIIHLNSLFNPLSSITFLYAKLFHPKTKIIWSVRGELNKNALQFSSWKKKPFLWLYKRLNKNVLYHSTSDAETSHIVELFPRNRAVQVPNLIAPARRLNLEKSNYLLFLGRIHPIKAIHKLIEALSLSERFKNSNFELLIVGKHEERHHAYKTQLEQQIVRLGLVNKIHFKGHIEGEEKEVAYAKAYGLILPSETENFGNVVVEALNQGTPVIASKGTPWQNIETYGAGFYSSNEPIELAKAIDKLLTLNAQEYNEMKANCIKLMKENYDVTASISKWIAIYKNL